METTAHPPQHEEEKGVRIHFGYRPRDDLFLNSLPRIRLFFIPRTHVVATPCAVGTGRFLECLPSFPQFLEGFCEGGEFRVSSRPPDQFGLWGGGGMRRWNMSRRGISFVGYEQWQRRW